MIGTITYILSRAGWRAMNGPLTEERRRLAGAEPPAAYVSYDPRLLAGAGWYGYRISFKGGDRQLIDRARYMLLERYNIRDSYEYYADGVYVIGVLLRQRVPHYGIGGGAPTPEPDALNFYMPNGGTISLNKTGSPTVVELEYCLDDNGRWIIWQPDNNGNRSLVLSAGQRMYVRNTSETSTKFSTWTTNFYAFSFSAGTYAGGDLRSLVCKIPSNASSAGSIFCFYGLFMNATNLIKANIKLLFTDLPRSFYRSMFEGCSNLIEVPETITATTSSGEQPCYHMFYGCSKITKLPKLTLLQLTDYAYGAIAENCRNLNYVYTEMTDISADGCLFNWLNNVSYTGDFYCPAELTIPSGANGIPSGWTRHDI